MEKRVEIIFNIYANLKFDYKLKSNPYDEDALNEELLKYEEVHIYNNFKDASILEELLSESLEIKGGTLDEVLIDGEDCSSEYDFKEEKIVITTMAKANLSLFTHRNDIDDFLDEIELKSVNCNVCINNYEVDKYYLHD